MDEGKKEIGTLADVAKEILAGAQSFDYRKVSLCTACNLAAIALGDEDDFVIFDNGGGMAFTIWRGEAARYIPTDNRLYSFVHAYRVSGIDTIIHVPLFPEGRQYIEWM